MAAVARKQVTLEEARIDARLRLTTLDGNLGLVARDADLHQARMEELRSRMPEGLAPEEVPGGKAREREMKTDRESVVEGKGVDDGGGSRVRQKIECVD